MFYECTFPRYKEQVIFMWLLNSIPEHHLEIVICGEIRRRRLAKDEIFGVSMSRL
jgi:hypothetical protein